MVSAASAKTVQGLPPVRVASEARQVGIELAGAVLMAACGHLLIKYGLNTALAVTHASVALRILSYLLLPRVILGLAVYGMGTLLWIAVVSKRDISYLYPITALNYVLITLGGIWLFGEPVSWRRWVGIAVVIIGVAVLQTSNREKKQ